MYVRAFDAGGAIWGAPIAVDPGQSKALFTSLKVVEGRPAIGYHGLANPANFLTGVIKYVRATNASGTAWGTPVEVDSPMADRAGYQVTMAIIGDKPAIGYFDDFDEDYTDQVFLRLATATDVRGDEWEAPEDVANLDKMFYYGYASLAEVNGPPAMCAAMSTVTFYIYY